LLSIGSLSAQDSKDSLDITVTPYVGLRGQVAVFNNQLELQENASRIGTSLKIKKGNIGFIAAIELQMGLFSGGSSLNADGNLAGDFLTIQSKDKKQVFGNRLGYLGIDMYQYGQLTFGKQWSVYRDITDYTDRFNVFGSKASATFIGGTDGGEIGTGRADQSISYRNRIGRFQFGAQVQARASDNSHFVDGYGFSAQVEVNPNLFVGSAFNRALLNRNLVQGGKIIGLTGNPTYFTIATKYSNQSFELALTYAHQENGDFTQGHPLENGTLTSRPTVVFDADGLELFGRYSYRKIAFIAGINYYLPVKGKEMEMFKDAIVDYGFKRNDLIIGLNYKPFQSIQLYSEQRLSRGKDAVGKREISIFTLGMKVDISKNIRHKAILFD